VGVQLGGAAAPGVTPDRSKTFETGVPPEMAGSSASTPGIPPVFGHLQSVVGLVWRSVVLWMLLLALLSLANLVGCGATSHVGTDREAVRGADG
jgi:adenosylcobinamide-phosphate synthase